MGTTVASDQLFGNSPDSHKSLKSRSSVLCILRGVQFSESEKKLCTWHVDRAWHRAIKQHVPGNENQIEVYHMLRSIMQELDKEEFERYLESFVRYVTLTAPQFASYFMPYSAHATEWAYCHRVGTQANTNMYIESFHYVLKLSYIERKTNKRVDILMSILFRVARDKVFERLIKVGKNGHSKKLHGINSRHVMVTQQLPESTSGG